MNQGLSHGLWICFEGCLDTVNEKGREKVNGNNNQSEDALVVKIYFFSPFFYLFQWVSSHHLLIKNNQSIIKEKLINVKMSVKKVS